MSIINNVEKYMKRYDYLMDKRERRYKQGKRLSEEEDEELRKLRPNVFTPILMMFEVLHDTVKTNQEYRQRVKERVRQTGGSGPELTPAIELAEVEEIDAATAAAVAAIKASQQQQQESQTPSDDPNSSSSASQHQGTGADAKADADAEEAEAKRLSELEASLLPLLTKIIVYIEENKKASKKKDKEADEEEKYPDIGTSAKNSAILVIRRIKKWWNDLISGGTSDLSSKINLKQAIPQLANNPTDMNNINAKAEELNELAEKATDAIHKPLEKIERILSNDVRDIASSSVEGIMNALSLIPGIGTTLQLWRLLQNFIVIISKSVTTMAGAKKEGVELKTGVQNIQGELKNLGDPSKLVASATSQGMPGMPGGMPGMPGGMPGMPGGMPEMPGGMPGMPGGMPGMPGGMPGMPGGMPGMPPGMPPVMKGGMPQGENTPAPAPAPAPAPEEQFGGTRKHSNHLRSIKKYKREYKQSLREIRKTRKNILRCIKNMI
jgi:hypothetical protein